MRKKELIQSMNLRIMALKGSLLVVKEKIGVVYTPIKWAKWAIEMSGAYKSWTKGASIVDPNVGEGIFIEAFISMALEKKQPINESLINSLYGYDLQPEGISKMIKRVKSMYGIDLNPDNFRNLDVITSELHIKFDFVVGNPPWVNFNNLPDQYKEELKTVFAEYGLIANSGSVLLGNSRVDISALVINVCIHKLLKPNGTLAMFVPSSLFFGGSAHNEFRNFMAKDRQFHLSRLHDFGSLPIFDNSSNHGTPYCFAEFELLRPKAKFAYYKLSDSSYWEKGEISISNVRKNGYIRNKNLSDDQIIRIPKISKPRQGVNTGGRNSIFMGTIEEGSISDKIVKFKNLDNKVFLIETALLYPLLLRDNLKDKTFSPMRYLIVAHDPQTGKILEEEVLKGFKHAYLYFKNLKSELTGRKGLLINVNISKGLYWGLMGLGKYSFSAYKIIWLTAGEKVFTPNLVDNFEGKPWQANQSLQAFLPFESKILAEQSFAKLKKLSESLDPEILGTPGTLGWGQPGRIMNILTLE
jgi:hypothetical protein